MSEETNEKIIKFPDGDAARFVAKARSILERSTATSWEFADFLAGPDAPADLTDGGLADHLGVARTTIVRYRQVARVWPEADRSPAMSFTHHMEVHRLPKAERMQLMASAKQGGWSVAEMRAAARQAASDGKLAATKEQVRSLKRQLEAARTDPRDTAMNVRNRLSLFRQLIKKDGTGLCTMLDECLKAEVIEGLHGNMRTGIARDLHQTSERMVAEMQAVIDHMAAVAKALNGRG